MRLQFAFSFLCSLSHPAILLCFFFRLRPEVRARAQISRHQHRAERLASHFCANPPLLAQHPVSQCLSCSMALVAVEGCRAAFWKGRGEGELFASDSFLRLPSDSVPPSWFSKHVPRGGAQSSWPLPGLCRSELLISINSEHVPVCRCAAAHTSTARVVVDSSRCRRQRRRQQQSSPSSATQSLPAAAVSSPVCTDVPCFGVFLQTGVLSPYPVALLAANAFCDPSFSWCKKKNGVVVAPPPPLRADPHCWLWADGEPLPPVAADIFPSRSALQDFFFLCSNPVSDVRCLLLSRSTRHAPFLAVFYRQGAALGGEC